MEVARARLGRLDRPRRHLRRRRRKRRRPRPLHRHQQDHRQGPSTCASPTTSSSAAARSSASNSSWTQPRSAQQCPNRPRTARKRGPVTNRAGAVHRPGPDAVANRADGRRARSMGLAVSAFGRSERAKGGVAAAVLWPPVSAVRSHSHALRVGRRERQQRPTLAVPNVSIRRAPLAAAESQV